MPPAQPHSADAGRRASLKCQAARDRWMQLMSNALDNAELPPDAKKELREFFDGVATFLMNREA